MRSTAGTNSTGAYAARADSASVSSTTTTTASTWTRRRCRVRFWSTPSPEVLFRKLAEIRPRRQPGRRTTMAKSKATGEVYQLKITLQYIKPPVWRRLQVKDCSLAKLHDLIQT